MRRPAAFRLIAVLLTVGLVAACGADDPAEPDATESTGDIADGVRWIRRGTEVEIPAGARATSSSSRCSTRVTATRWPTAS